MCIHYYVEFWLPVSNMYPDWESKVKRGLAKPGKNPEAKVVDFYECQGRFLSQARCPLRYIRREGCYRSCILDFCYEDKHCFTRMGHMQWAYVAAKREAERVVHARQDPLIQAQATRKWQKAYNDWWYAYEQHRDCPYRRYKSELFQDLKRAGIVSDQAYYDDETRMGTPPRTQIDPIVGIYRLHDAPLRRR